MILLKNCTFQILFKYTVAQNGLSAIPSHAASKMKLNNCIFLQTKKI